MIKGRHKSKTFARLKLRVPFLTGLTVLVAGALVGMPTPASREIRGFAAQRASRQLELEKSFRESPTADRARLDLWALTSEPRVAGTPEDYRSAQFVLEQIRQAGLEVEIAEYDVLLAMPREIHVNLIAPVERKGPTPEGGWTPEGKPADPRAIAGYNAYSPPYRTPKP